MAERGVSGWVWPENVVKLMEWLAFYVGYEFTESDEIAVLNATGARFDYPIIGEPRLDVAFERDPEDGGPVTVTVTGWMTDELAARVDTLIALLADLVPRGEATSW